MHLIEDSLKAHAPCRTLKGPIRVCDILCVPLPAQPLGDEPHAGRGEHAPDGEDGHGQRPQGGEGPRWDGLSIPVHPCSVIVRLDDLQREQE